jgi:hypothetical protein
LIGLGVREGPELSAREIADRLRSRTLVMDLIANSAADVNSSDSGGSNGDNGDGLDGESDTRLVLLKRFGGRRVPVRARVAARLAALGASWRGLLAEARGSRSLGRELAVLWLAWFLVLCAERFTPTGHGAEGNAIFSSLFELCSAYGNVGLSIGSPNKTNVSFSADWSRWSQLVLLMVMVTGRTRELPTAVDGALELARGHVVAPPPPHTHSHLYIPTRII